MTCSSRRTRRGLALQAAHVRGQFEFCQKRGQDADRTYTEQAQAVRGQIAGLVGELRAPPVLGGAGAGPSVPITVTSTDVNFARAMLPAIMAVRYSAWGENPGQELTALNQGQPLTPSQVLGVYEAAKAQQANAQGSVIDGLGGLVSTATGA